MKTIGIIGGGFSGIMTAVQLIRNADIPFSLIVFNDKESLAKGIAYTPFSRKHILNVPAVKMSAFPAEPEHFLNWVMSNTEYGKYDKKLIAHVFMPRYLYGAYLTEIWELAKQEALTKKIIVQEIHSEVTDLNLTDKGVEIHTENGQAIFIDYCVLATGNQVPGNPEIKNKSFYSSLKYFGNPWKSDSVSNLNPDQSVMIFGNGLTMVDTVLGLIENKHKGNIYTISPNGFYILPHKHIGAQYDLLSSEIHDKLSLREVISIVNKHRKAVAQLGYTPELVIDALRPFVQKLWQNFTPEEKKIFISKIRPMWGAFRHRVPMHMFEFLQKLSAKGRLIILTGKIKDILETEEGISLEYYDKKKQINETITISRIINCTGPESNFNKLEKCLMKNIFEKGIIMQDPLKLGICTDANTFQVKNADGKNHENFYTLGSNLRGELWESTAVGELRVQASQLAEILLNKIGIPVLI